MKIVLALAITAAAALAACGPNTETPVCDTATPPACLIPPASTTP